jgi:tetratricopeptide (TPR) repeat protein
MARADRRRVARPKPAAGSRSANGRSRDRDASRALVEDTMFFPKLRRHAKWMFVALALVFGLGFVIFGVGSDVQGGLGDLLRDEGVASDTPSVEEARESVRENPTNAEAHRDLANALTVEARTDDAIAALTRYIELRPRDENALRELAGLYLTQATRRQQEAEVQQLRANYLTGGSTFTSQLELPGGASLDPDPIVNAVTTKSNEAVNRAYTSAQESYRKAADAYEKVVTFAPNDPNIQLELAQTAQRSGDIARAIAAYERFVKLAPDDPSTEIVKQQIKQLKGLNP